MVSIHAVALSPQAAVSVVNAADSAGFGIRQYSTLESLLDSVDRFSVGCVLVSCDDDPRTNSHPVMRLKAQLPSIPIVAMLSSDSAAAAVELMQLGVFSVLVRPFEQQRIVSTVTAALERSADTHSAVRQWRDAVARLREATRKELDVLQLIMDGKKNREIAELLGITVRAVEDRRFRLMKKTGVESVAELIALAVGARYFDLGLAFGVPQSATIPRSGRGIRGIEIWVPSDHEDVLTKSQSCYPDVATFDTSDERITCRRGEGLPGTVWESRAPMFLTAPFNGSFLHGPAARDDELINAIGIPIFCEGRVQSVVIMLVDSRQHMKAAFESWRMDPDHSFLRLSGGTFINCERLRRLSQYLLLPNGEGLPGFVAAQALPYAGSRFAEDSRSVRGIALAAEQLTSGIAMPLTDSGSAFTDVFLLFNSETTPMFSLLQIWKPTGREDGVKLAAEYVDGVPSVVSQMDRVSTDSANSIAGKCWQTGRPVLIDSDESQAILHSSSVTAPTFGIALPTLIDGRVVAVTVLAS